ncbi:aspartyl-phosphate phosphatase Spo0E family protein [Lysinibacillus sp. 54212]|uniref:aspartyl-phosphate phosphatase Spo0E family protein n=1 Tax=Lysinibacillus sp. 54212 TaxID=3119829 RepID=UPI002FCC904B
MDKCILKQLEQTRELMIQAGMKYGLQNIRTIKLSRQLDELLNEYAGKSRGNRDSQKEANNLLQ